ncbi:hypothetical protein HW555_003206, partial [Spodoptera exigua]
MYVKNVGKVKLPRKTEVAACLRLPEENLAKSATERTNVMLDWFARKLCLARCTFADLRQLAASNTMRTATLQANVMSLGDCAASCNDVTDRSLGRAADISRSLWSALVLWPPIRSESLSSTPPAKNASAFTDFINLPHITPLRKIVNFQRYIYKVE